MNPLRKTTGPLMILFITGCVSIILWHNHTRPRILILHSYSADYVWTREVNKGLERILNQEARISVHHHEMRTKRFHEKDELRRAGIVARRVIERIQPDVLIAIDDYAQKLAARFFIDHPGIRIVFAGVNGRIEPYGYHRANNVTGILERKPVAAIREVLMALGARGDRREQPIRALFLSDSSYSSKRDADYMDSFSWAPIHYLGARFMETYQQWQEQLPLLAGQVDFLLVAGYRKLPRNGNSRGYAAPEQVMGWTEAHSPVPVIGLNVFNTEDGAMLSVGVSPYEQGETAAAMALDIIHGDNHPGAMPVKTSEQYVVSMRAGALKRRGLTLPSIFEAFSKATNNHFD